MKENIFIEIAKTEKKYLKCLEIRKKVFIEEQKVPKYLEVDEFEDDSIHFIAIFNNETVGCARFRVVDNFIKFERFAVLKEYRKLGIGSKLLKFMQKIAFEKHKNLPLIMNAQEKAINFYKKNGWKTIGKPFLEANIKHVVMIYLIKDKSQYKKAKVFF